MCSGPCDVMSESDDSDDFDGFTENEKVILRFMEDLREDIDFSDLDIEIDSTAAEYQDRYNRVRCAQKVQVGNYIDYFREFFFRMHDWDEVEANTFYFLFDAFDENYDPFWYK
jgi:hypothetical protein